LKGNATGKPRVVINGTCLGYLAESFMAGDPLNGGAFAKLTDADWHCLRAIRFWKTRLDMERISISSID
jgi:hypothetical protein